MSLTGDAASALRALVPPRAEPAATTWFDAAWEDAGGGAGREQFSTLFAAAGRKLGRATVVTTAMEEGNLRAAGFSPVPPAWGLDECGRGALLLHVADSLASGDGEKLASDLFMRGEVRERQALLRVLAYLPEPAAHRSLALEACRSSAQTVFEAIACDNPYPATHFADPSFNQMALKAVFTGAPLARVHGLVRRVTSDLVRMAEDYAAERRAAGRPVPADLDLILSAPRPA